MPMRPRSFGRIDEDAFGGGDGDRWDAAGFLLLLVTVALAGLLEIGGVHRGIPGPGARLRVVEVFAFLTMTVTFLSRSKNIRFRPLAIPLTAFAGLVVLGLAQVVPLPDGFLRIAAPLNATTYHAARETLAVFGVPGPLPRVSLAPSETVGALLALLASGAFFLSAAILVRGPARRRLFAAVLAIASVLGAIPAILAGITGRPAEGPDAAAAGLEIVLALAFAVLWSEILTGRRRSSAVTDPSDRIERRILPVAGRFAAWLGAGALVAATASRSGIAAAGVTGILLPLAAAAHPRGRGRWKSAVLLSLAAAAAGVGIAAAMAATRTSIPERPSAPATSAVRRATLDAWRQSPALGSGLGAFAEGLGRAQREPAPQRIREPRSDAAGILVTGGTVGAVLAALLAASLAFLLVRAWLRQRHREESAYALAGVGALFSILAHGLGASVLAAGVPLCLAAILGASWSAAGGGSLRRADRSERAENPKTAENPGTAENPETAV